MPQRSNGAPARQFGLLVVLLTAAMVLAAGCRAPRPLVERLGDDPDPPAYRVESLGGQRAGMEITFTLRLVDPGGRRLAVDGRAEIDPQPRLVGGSWNDGERSGTVSSAALEFWGGQGGRPSLGGSMTLSDAGGDRYRIVLPPTVLEGTR